MEVVQWRFVKDFWYEQGFINVHWSEDITLNGPHEVVCGISQIFDGVFGFERFKEQMDLLLVACGYINIFDINFHYHGATGTPLDVEEGVRTDRCVFRFGNLLHMP